MNLCMTRIRENIDYGKMWNDFKLNSTRDELISIVFNAENEMKMKIIECFNKLGYEVRILTLVYPFDYNEFPSSELEIKNNFIDRINFRVHIFDKKGSVYTIYKLPETVEEFKQVIESELQKPKNLVKTKTMTFLVDLKSKLFS